MGSDRKNKDSNPALTFVSLDFSASKNPTDIKYIKNYPAREI